MNFAYERQPFLDVDHTHGPAVTGLAHKIVLNENNFDFSQVRSDLFDVQFADALGNVLPHYLYHYDETRKQAIFFVKIDLLAGEVKPITLRWGDPTIGVDPSDDSVCVYANRLASASDLADLDTTFGTLSTAIVTDTNAPEGNALEFSGGTSHTGLMKTFALPGTYEAWLMEMENVGQGSGAYPGALVEASDNSNWFRAGRWDGDGRLNIRDQAGDAWIYTNGSTAEAPSDGAYIMQQTLVGPNRVFVEVDAFDMLGTGAVERGSQGLAYHPDVGLISTGSNEISRWSLDGTEQEYLSVTPQGTSFGGGQIVDLKDDLGLQFYFTRFDEATPQSTIYRCNPLDLASGITLVADITQYILPSADGDVSINSLSYDANRKRWYVGTTRTSTTRCDIYEFSQDFTTSYGRINAHEADQAGFQGSDWYRGMLVLSEHNSSSAQLRSFWQQYALDESARVAWPTHALYSTLADSQGIAYDQERDVWYAIDRPSSPNRIVILRLDVDNTERQVTGRWGFNAGSIGSASAHDLAPPAQTQVGVGAYRACRVANLAYIKTVYPLPVNRLPVSSNSTVIPTPAGVLNVAGAPRAVSVS